MVYVQFARVELRVQQQVGPDFRAAADVERFVGERD